MTEPRDKPSRRPFAFGRLASLMMHATLEPPHDDRRVDPYDLGPVPAGRPPARVLVGRRRPAAQRHRRRHRRDLHRHAHRRTAPSQYLSDRAWVSATNDWGPVEKDASNGENAAGDGRAITLNGQAYAKGLGVHAPSEVRYSLGGACTRFTADVGLDDESGAVGAVVFEVWADDAKLYESGVMNGAAATKQADVSVAGKREPRLVLADGGNGVNADHGAWADARLTRDS